MEMATSVISVLPYMVADQHNMVLCFSVVVFFHNTFGNIVVTKYGNYEHDNMVTRIYLPYYVCMSLTSSRFHEMV